TYDDGNGNTITQNQTVIVDDVTAPVPDVATLPTVTGECSATIATAPTATDACAGTITGTTSDALTYTTQGTYTVTWTYDDGNGNTITQNQTVIVDDVTAPVPDAATLPTVTGECSGTIATAPTATDACAGTITGTTSDALTYTTQGTYTLTWTYDDGNGNISTQTQDVVIADVTVPTITAPSALTVSTDAGSCEATGVSPGTPTTSDNCGVASVTNDAPATFPSGSTTVTWTVTDVNGLSSTAMQV
ncbi:MAG: HYR domain-containing protein, partial [Bacteroidales bacterium]|nr:HYR domain-containing protein [Bacteroidales bacterium]